MKGQDASSPEWAAGPGPTFDVTTPDAVTLFLKDRPRRVLGTYLGRENTVAGAARETGLDVRVVHRDTLALVSAGLLRVTRTEARAGRPVKHYRTPADRLYLNFLNTPAADLDDLDRARWTDLTGLFHRAANREYTRALREAGRTWGQLMYATPDPPGFDVIEGERDADPVDALTHWQGPAALFLRGTPTFHLTDPQAAELQHDLIGLMRKYAALHAANQAAGTGRAFLTLLGLAPLTEEEHAALYR